MFTQSWQRARVHTHLLQLIFLKASLKPICCKAKPNHYAENSDTRISIYFIAIQKQTLKNTSYVLIAKLPRIYEPEHKYPKYIWRILCKTSTTDGCLGFWNWCTTRKGDFWNLTWTMAPASDFIRTGAVSEPSIRVQKYPNRLFTDAGIFIDPKSDIIFNGYKCAVTASERSPNS